MLEGKYGAPVGGAQSHPVASVGLFTVADVAATLNLKPQVANGKTEWHGKNPSGNGAQENGFILFAEGNALDRKTGEKFTSHQVAQFARIEPEQYQPVAQYRARNRNEWTPPGAKAPSPSRDSTSNSAATNSSPDSAAKPKELPFDWKAATLFDYRDEKGVLRFQVGRIDLPDQIDPKTGKAKKLFRQRRPSSTGGWISNLHGVERVLFNLRDIIKAGSVLFCEGEKATNALNEDLKGAGLYGPTVATTTAQGAGATLKTDLQPLHCKTVGILPDNNAQGARQRDDLLNALGERSKCRVIELPNRGEGDDYVDFRAADGTVEAVIAMIDAAPVITTWTNPANLANPLISHSAFELLSTDFPEPEFIVYGIIPEGLAILGGHPKLGKSWAMLAIAVAVACGGRAFGQIEVEAGDVLYLALEDTPRRMKSRLAKQLAGQRPPELHRLHMAYQWPRTNEGGLEALDKWLCEHHGARLVVIDTLQKIKPQRKGSSSIYESDSDDVGDLKALSDKYGAAIVCVHHLRKGDGDDPVEALSGSYGLSGAADTLLILQRVRGQVDATLFVTGRDLDEVELALKFDKELAQWNLLGDASEYKLTSERHGVLTALKSMTEPVTPTQLWERTRIGKNLNNLKQMLWTMSKEGEIHSEGGKYSVGVIGVSPVSAVSPRRSTKKSSNAQSEPYGAAPTGQPNSDNDDLELEGVEL